MRSMQTRWMMISAGLMTMFISVIGYQAYAISQVVPEPAVIATIDLEQMFNGLDQRRAIDEELNKKAQELKDRADAMAEEIIGLEEEVEVHTPGTDAHRKALEALQLASIRYQAHAEFARRKIDIEQALALKRLYVNIKESARTMSEELGLDIVFVDDSVVRIANGSEVEVRQQIAARRMLYTNPEIDVTTQLVTRMNIAFSQTVQPAPGAAAGVGNGTTARP